MKEKKVSLRELLIGIYSFLLFNTAFININNNILFYIINCMTFIITFFLYIIFFSQIIQKCSKIIIFLLITFLALVIYSLSVNNPTNFSIDGYLPVIRLAMILFSTSIGFFILLEKKYAYILINVFFLTLIFYCLANDLIFIPHFTSFNSSQMYLLGNKFNVAYLHLELLCFYFLKISFVNRKPKSVITLVFIIFYTLFIDILIDCISGIVGLIICLLIIYVIPKKITVNPISWLIVWGISSLVPFLYQKIVESSLYQNIVLGTLNRSITMTGRMNIYKEVPFIMYDHWKWGYGWNNSYNIVYNYMKMPDMQNGTLDLVLQIGIMGALLYFLIVFVTFYKIDKSNKSYDLLPVISLIYAFTVLSSFEVTFDTTFLTICILCAMFEKNYNELSDMDDASVK
ncbi:hypothetical protein DKZ31_08280 [Limosilactobacillus reuteri]|uniref:Polymerase n=2 Tax=Limosilactobacillus reuteri TaxID=1598 RepID=A0ABD6Y5A4_LIMRT|nr:O-antigen ligase family protein [Limosilactobacillus reuteri]PWT34545.1 hypothetical protein DKZ24_08400 [Limosilactobacillus reuteri]PWT36861.1 hypothetical protein DKZ35_08075 [Limosilactobacillus reuteri]PWT40358.1 hypothetical protein DKZ34_06135 [Limosilactobacillus reuteri]PWT53379.1 hypothetical protein DKZ31_08280 [Limosilactobacillus reuteri]PWT58367.1 hypothetical protein DKZ30_08310 [Limosilactobacillus reuteri]